MTKKNNLSHPLFDDQNKYYKRIYALEFKDKRIYALEFKDKRIYYFNSFGKIGPNYGFHVGFNFAENQKFLWLQGSHWLQKEENIRYCINIIFLIIGLVLGILKSRSYYSFIT